MEKEYAEYLINKTRDDYNLIAKRFSSTRRFFWKDLEPLIDYTRSGDKVLDFGCGNGRLLGAFGQKNIKTEYIGLDNSEGLIEEAKKKFPQADFQVSKSPKIPFPENNFDRVYSIAVLHHIPSNDLRADALREIKRVLKPNGLLILTVWNLWQRKTAWEHFFKNSLLKIIGKTKLDFKDIFVPWKDENGQVIAQRYYHLFTKKELKKMAERAGFKIKKIGILKRPEKKDSNIYLVAEK